jgi:hypothetical protein
MNDVYCRGCGSKISSTAAFCPLCGYVQASSAPPQAPLPPQPQSQPQTIIVKQGSNSSTFWIVFTLLAIFTPLGCIVFPALIVGGGMAALAGVALLPLIFIGAPAFIGIMIGAKLWRESQPASSSRNTALIIMGAGCFLSLVFFFTVFPVKGSGALAPSVRATPVPTPTPEKRPYIGWFAIDPFGNFYDANKIAAKTKYGGKRIAIRGQIGMIFGDVGDGSLTLKGIDTLTEITCEFNPRTTKQLANVRPGQLVDVIGDFDGGKSQSLGTDKLTMTDCTFPPTTDARISQSGPSAASGQANPLPTPAPAKVSSASSTNYAEKNRQESEALAASVRNLVAAVGNDFAGFRWETHSNSGVRLYAPGPVSEYQAERLAKVFADRLPLGVTVRVYDDAGLERGKSTHW